MDARTLNRSTGHSAYLTQDTTSQHNIATVVVGAEDRMIEVPR
jgi:cell division septation protein DedD